MFSQVLEIECQTCRNTDVCIHMFGKDNCPNCYEKQVQEKLNHEKVQV